MDTQNKIKRFKNTKKLREKGGETGMKKLTFTTMAVFMAVAMVGLYAHNAMAVTGQCANCHTMHYSQDGGVPTGAGGSGPYGRLLLDSCVGCHSSTTANEVIKAGNIPIVNGPAANTDYLAGGNFGVLTGGSNDSYGHNCLGTPDETDGTLANTPPGYGGSGYSGTQLSCAGTSGCHGDRTITGSGDGTGDDYVALDGAHHGNVDGSLTTASTVGNSYRFLKGIHGYEDPTWEDPSTLNATTHNQYKGLGRTDETDPGNTISSLCAQCHGDFHNGVGNVGTGSPWVRHPSDFDLGDATGSEYASYNGGTGAGNTYSTIVPVGSESVAAVLGTVNINAADGTAIVTCISCHRAHTGVDEDLLRWDYTTMIAGSGAGNVGCFVCHTTKD
ncbi:MAG: hypothetical protein SVW57_04965 [Thermodesulfobacteriota bacterium]|nr:hypothetical protein [Thermodesulfobacteriota bacterium]